jgi:glycerophosphoryl diester phosphodiesterase
VNPLIAPGQRLVIGHRGAAAHAPENTLESFREALAQGAHALEFDVRRSADGVAMVCHDPTLDRTTNGTGPLSARSAAELQAFDAGYHFTPDGRSYPFRGREVRIPTLAEVVEAFPAVPLLIEIKEIGVQELVAAELRARGAEGRAVVAGDDARALLVFREPPFLLGGSRRDIARLYFGMGRPDPRCRAYAVPEYHYGLPIPTRRLVRRARELGAAVHVWTVDDPAAARRWWANGVSGIVTNRPGTVLQALQALQAPSV